MMLINDSFGEEMRTKVEQSALYKKQERERGNLN